MSRLGERMVDILADFGLSLEQDLADSLIENGVSGSGGNASRFAESIRMVMPVKETGVQISMQDIWEYLEYGTKPSKFQGNKHSVKKIESIIAWIKWKGLTVTLSKRAEAASSKLKNKTVRKSFREMSYDARIKSLAFAIATSIAKRGTSNRARNKTFMGPKGTNFIKEVINDGRVEQLEKQIADEIGIQITVDFTEAFKNYGNNK